MGNDRCGRWNIPLSQDNSENTATHEVKQVKQGTTLQGLAIEVQRQLEAKKDFIGDTRGFSIVNGEDGDIRLQMNGHGNFGIRHTAHLQIGDRLRIPRDYYGRMLREAPGLLRSNVNHWMANNPEKRLVRTLDGDVRAFLSDRYRILDNYGVADAILPVLSDSGADLRSCDVTDTRMYLKAVMPNVEVDIPPPLGSPQLRPVTVQPGIVISNSEVGMGSLAIEPAVHTLACLNMAVWAQSALKKRHVGRVLSNGKNGNEEDIWEYFTDDTRRASDEATWKQVRDLTQAALTGPAFDDIVKKLRESREARIEGDPVEVVQRVGQSKGLTESERSGVLRHLIEGGELSMFGLHNAITRQSQDIEDYDRASDLEALGGKVIELTRSEWQAVQS